MRLTAESAANLAACAARAFDLPAAWLEAAAVAAATLPLAPSAGPPLGLVTLPWRSCCRRERRRRRWHL